LAPELVSVFLSTDSMTTPERCWRGYEHNGIAY
jgi:hypothetical protein